MMIEGGSSVQKRGSGYARQVLSQDGHTTGGCHGATIKVMERKPSGKGFAFLVLPPGPPPPLFVKT